MRFDALACDYDGTLAHHGHVDEATCDSLRALLKSGRKLLLVTGRELPELQKIFPEMTLFHAVVAENGGLLHTPATGEERPLAEPPPKEFVAKLMERGVTQISVGRVIVATWQPFETIVLDVIKEMGLELHLIFNKGAVMILPSGVNKATGLAYALEMLQLQADRVIAVGDAENDHAFLQSCGCGVAVANALPALKERACLVTEASHGAGVAELIDVILHDEGRLQTRPPAPQPPALERSTS